MTTQVLGKPEVELFTLDQVLNKYLQQKLKGKTLLIANEELGVFYKNCDSCEVIYTKAEGLNGLELSLMKFHNVVTHNFNHTLTEVKKIQERCEKAKIRFIAFKEIN